jgi:drug/metabolite transporter (DMT)-like permease
MAAALALLSSLLFGAGDFLGGGASRRNHVLVVVAVSHVVGLGLILAAAPFMADEATLEDLVYGLGAGAFGLVGIGCLYHALGRGPMAVVAPVTAVTNAALPVLWGIGFGERLTTLHLAGVVVGMFAIFLVSRAPEDSSGTAAIGPVTPGLLLECLVAGAGFGGFFVFMDLTSADTAPWPLVSARILSAGVALLLLARMRHSPLPSRGEGGVAMVGAGVLDMAANLCMLLAVHRGMLSLVAVLGSLYPASTVILARTVLGERMNRTQGVGLVLALVAVAGIING